MELECFASQTKAITGEPLGVEIGGPHDEGDAFTTLLETRG